MLVKFLFGLADVLADLGPQFHLLVVAEPIVAGPGAIPGHIARLIVPRTPAYRCR